MRKRALLSAVLGIVLFATFRAAADDPSPDQLFTEGLGLMEGGQFTDALERLERAHAKEPGIGTEFNIALCYEQLGKLGSAWRHYTNVVVAAHAGGKTHREESARQKLEALRPRVSAFAFAPAAPAGLTVRLDGVALPPASWTMVAVDEGDHVVEAEAAGRERWQATLTTPAPGEVRVVEVPPLAATEAKVVIVSNEAPNTRRMVGLVLGGVGVAGLAAAVVTGILLLDEKSTADAGCRPVCARADGSPNQEAIDAVNHGRTLLPLNLAAWGIAALGIGAGTYLVLTSSKKAKGPRAVIAPSIGGILVRGEL